MLELDGSAGEGGGQVLRTALALAAVTAEPFRITRIRANRPQPGLRPQHLAVAQAFAAITNGRLEGGELGSRELLFEPGPMRGGELHVDIGTAGSIPLLLQALLPALARSGAFWRLTVTGGTDGKWAPPWDYFVRVHVDTLERLGWRPRAKLVRRGWYPRGGGGAVLEAGPWEPAPFVLARTGRPFRVQGRVAVTNLPDSVPARVRTAALGVLERAGFPDAEVDITGNPGLDPGVAFLLRADDGACILGADGLGEPGKPAEEVGREAAEELVREVRGGGSVDLHASNQLMVYAALAAARGPCSFTARDITTHARTNAEVIARFLPVRWDLREEAGLARFEVRAA